MSKKFKWNKKKLLITLGVVLLLAGAVVAGMITQMITNGNTTEEEQLPRPTLPEVVDDVQTLRDEGNEEEFAKKVDEALANPSTDDDTRYMLYIQQGHDAFDKQQWQAAIDAYSKAESIESTMETAELLAETYAASGDSTKAIEYFKKAIPLIPEDNPFRQSVKESFEIRITELGGQP